VLSALIASTLAAGVLAAPIPVGPVTPAGAVQATPDTGLAAHPRVREALDLVDTWLDAQRAYEEIPGISAAVVRDQEQLWSGAYGWSNPGARLPAEPGTVYSICSISKLFTSVAVLQLRDRGRLELDDPVGRHLPWFDIRRAHPEGPEITVEGLLTHSAGLPRESDHPYWTGPDFDFPTREQVREGLDDQETLYPARRYFQYSNLGLSLAGEIVSELSGGSYHDYVRRNILDPLGLDDTWSDIPVELHGERMALGYGAIERDGDRSPVDVFQARGIAPAAGYASTVEDLGRFAMWQFRLEPGDEEVLSGNTLREMQRVHWVDPDWDTHWGLGFSVWRDDDETYVGHGGSCPGYRTHLSLQMDRKVAVAFAANALGVSPSSFTRRIHAILKPALAEATADGGSGPSRSATDGGENGDGPAPAAAQEAPDLDRYVGTYDASFGGEIAVLRWKGGLAMLGLPTDEPLESLTELRHQEGNTFRRVRDDGALGERVTFETDDRGRVTRMVRFSNYYPRISDGDEEP